MLDIKLFRENPEIIKKSEKRRGRSTKNVEEVIKYDKIWRNSLKKGDKLKHKRNLVTQEIASLKKEGKSGSSKIKETRKISSEIKKNEERIREYLEKRDEVRYKIGNIVHKSVPKGMTEDDAKLIRKWGKKPKFKFKVKGHADLVVDLDIVDVSKASKVVGSRSYYLKKDLVLLNLALIRFAFDRLIKEDFIPIWTPFLLNKNAMKGAAELGDFEEQLYKLDGEDLFLIATSEQTLIAQHMNDLIPEKDLPVKYVGFSTNFRKEAGTHGKDTKGIFRTHQFDKVEQVIICKPEDSWKFHEKMIKNTEKLYHALKIPYIIRSIAAGDLNDNAAKKYDLESWFPAQNKYRELVSGSNCTDYQARKLNIRFVNKKGEREFVHILNCTGIATERTICAILENYQQKDGSVKIPSVLVPYMNGIKKIKRKN